MGSKAGPRYLQLGREMALVAHPLLETGTEEALE